MQRFALMLALTISCGALAAGNAFPPTLDDTAERIRDGSLDVGETRSLEFPGRFHTVHMKALGMGCLACHATPGYGNDHLFLRKAEFPRRGHAGAVPRATCIGCHQQGGSATSFYTPAAK
jgi:hypothetical protein